MFLFSNCPVCESHLLGPPGQRNHQGSEEHYFSCPLCGGFGISRTTGEFLQVHLGPLPERRPVLSYEVRRRQIGTEWPLINWETCKKIIESGTLPAPWEQADNAIRWFGVTSSGPGDKIDVKASAIQSIIGATDTLGVTFVLGWLKDNGLIYGPRPDVIEAVGGGLLKLTMEGWARYEELKQGSASGRNAFMAMKFGDDETDAMFNDHFRKAVDATGFVLKRLDDDPKAGLIDDRLRVEIRGASFLIADLTHDNNGAYWEAGYAEGLGKPVIYTCEKSKFDKGGTHFDTNHHLTVVWDANEIEKAVEQLKATIRATLPEAKQQDD